jgi:hypothetical protein
MNSRNNDPEGNRAFIAGLMAIQQLTKDPITYEPVTDQRQQEHY